MATLDLNRLAAIDPGDYQTAAPFPHVVIDDALLPGWAARLATEFPPGHDPRWKTYVGGTEWQKQEGAEGLWGAQVRTVLDEMHRRPFLDAVERLTGIGNLLADTWGGGMHQSGTGARLEVHADYNRHPYTGWWRRINVLLYLNVGWRPGWGGDLELWDETMTRPVRTVRPVAGRLVIMNSGETTYHGHPHPLTCPPDVTRKSLAVYLFTEQPPADVDPEAVHSTIYQQRPEGV